LAPDSTRVRLDSAFAAYQPRNDKVIKMVRKIVSKTNFKIMVMGDRVSQLDYLYNTLSEKGVDVSRLYSKYKKAKNARVMVVGVKMGSTGFDEKTALEDWDGLRVDLLIMLIATYKSEQPVGRALRSENPKVIQILDKHRWIVNTWKENVKWFQSRNAEILEETGWDEVTQLVIDEFKDGNNEDALMIGGGEEDSQIPEASKAKSKGKEKATDEKEVRIALVHHDPKRVGHM